MIGGGGLLISSGLDFGTELGIAEVKHWKASMPLEPWRDEIAAGRSVPWVVVAMWAQSPVGATPMVELDDQAWNGRLRESLAAWVAGLGAAARRCAAGGRIVALFERPATLEAAGFAAEAAVADAVEALVRSLALSEGARQVRVNGVSTPNRLVPQTPAAPVPSVAAAPSGVGSEIRAAVEMLIGPGVAGVTGTVVHTDRWRSS